MRRVRVLKEADLPKFNSKEFFWRCNREKELMSVLSEIASTTKKELDGVNFKLAKIHGTSSPQSAMHSLQESFT